MSLQLTDADSVRSAMRTEPIIRDFSVFQLAFGRTSFLQLEKAPKVFAIPLESRNCVIAEL